MPEFIPADKVEWKPVKIIKLNTDGPADQHPYEYRFDLPVPLADWDVFDYWERERFDSMRDNLKKGMVLFDIGTEQGWCNLIYAQFVGPENMVLIEPTLEFWPNIKQIWERNYPGIDPKACAPVLLSDKNTEDYDFRNFKGVWPAEADGDMIDRNKYQYIDDNSENIPEMTIDAYVQRTGVVPDALTMDTEGAEIAILRGAEQTIKKHKPLVWASVHPDLAIEHGFGDTKNVYEFMEKCGYDHKYLATDHEVHELFYPKGTEVK